MGTAFSTSAECKVIDDCQPDRPCEVSDGSPCTACIERVRLESRIEDTKQHVLQLDQALKSMLHDHRKLRTRANRIHNPIILAVPSEIASRIFQFSLPKFNDSFDGLRTAVKAPLTLGAVCSDWRSIAWSTPQLWTTVSICLGAVRLSSHAGCIQEWLERSKALPLTIYLRDSRDNDLKHAGRGMMYDLNLLDSFSAVRQISGILNQHSDRWAHLDITIPARFLSLFQDTNVQQPLNQFRSLHISASDYVIERDAKFCMKSLTPANVILYCIPPKSLSINWKHVTHLDVSTIEVQDCYRLLRQASQLHFCRFFDITPPSSRGNWVPTRDIIHPCIKEFVVELMDELEEIDTFFGHLGLPDLQRMTLAFTGEVLPCDPILSFLQRSSCKLRDLRIHHTKFDAAHFVAFLRQVPSLISLDVSPWSANSSYSPKEFFRLLAKPSSSEIGSSGEGRTLDKELRIPISIPGLPSLQSFKCTDERKNVEDFPWKLAFRILGPVSQMSGSYRQTFKAFRIHFSNDDLPYPDLSVDKKALSLLCALRHTGVDIQISTKNRSAII